MWTEAGANSPRTGTIFSAPASARISWTGVTSAWTWPTDPGPKPIAVDATHVIYPRNTEYEIFTVGKKGHVLGAFFVINHKRVFEQGVPPVQPIGKLAHDEGALIDLDKPNWPWSMLLVALLKVDLYELANNHVWRTEFGFPNFGEPAPEYMGVERAGKGFTERGWIDYGLQNYYALLNCGFRLRPTAGTASGVHPVPLGFGRVYVHCPDGFSYDAWVRGLKTTYYLRTLAATSAEKSTGRGGELNAVPELTAVASIGTAARATSAATPEAEPKFCATDNPDCEACQ